MMTEPLIDTCTRRCIKSCIGLSRHTSAVPLADMVAVFGREPVLAVARSMLNRYAYGPADNIVKSLETDKG